MKKVITYGTYDLLHYGHVALLKRAKALGDYLIVGVTADGFDRERGKLNVRQSLVERIEAVRALGIADQIIVEEYEGQKISDIQKYGVDIFTVGSDWVGKFDYLKEYCQVYYLPRTEGISSTEIRASEAPSLSMGILGADYIAQRIIEECKVVSGVRVDAVWDRDPEKAKAFAERNGLRLCGSVRELTGTCDTIFLNTPVNEHFEQISCAIEAGCHVISNPPIFMDTNQAQALYEKADQAGVYLFEGTKTLYFPGFEHMILLIKSGLIGTVRDIDVCCTQIPANIDEMVRNPYLGSLYDWGSTIMLPIVKLYEGAFTDCHMTSFEKDGFSFFTRGMLNYPGATASFRAGRGMKSEGELVITGTKGYIYVPAPWWRTEYFEFRSEDLRNVKKYFFNYEGEGLRYMLYRFMHLVNDGNQSHYQTARADTLRAIALLDRFADGSCSRIPY